MPKKSFDLCYEGLCFLAEVCAFFRSLCEFRKIVLLCKKEDKKEDKADCSNGVWITLTRTLNSLKHFIPCVFQ